MLSSAIVAFRLSPDSFARFIGDPLNVVLNCSSVMTSSSSASARAFFPAIAGRGAKGESVGSARANFTFHGHTSWQMSRYTHFKIPLSTGARTLAQGEAESSD